ncbi:MAG TPA: hypothetical protein VM283_07870, partial [Armatimonadota bacterium]|nr:hypothetical protein [Armatimonadota bacterium]
DTGASAAWGRAGEILADKGLLEAATTRLRQALQTNPDNPVALARLPQVYRARGMEAEAEAVEYDLRLRELQDLIVAAHSDLMAEVIGRAWELAGRSAADAAPEPMLADVIGDRSYADVNLGVCLQLPAGWEFATERDPSALVMRHRFRPELAHLRVIRVPERVGLGQLMALYYERSFQHEAWGMPLAEGTLRTTRATEVVTATGDVFCQTTFARRGELVWILSLTTTARLRPVAASDLQSIADGFVLLR